jgi:hypothetical protein
MAKERMPEMKKMGNSGQMTSNGEPFCGSIPHALTFLPFSSFMALVRPCISFVSIWRNDIHLFKQF